MMVRIYAEGRPGSWEAICLDFDLAVQGGSFPEVLESMEIALSEYFEYVGALPESEQPAFFKRKAPLSLRAKFAWHAVRNLFGGDDASDGNGKGRADVMLPAPA